jgi:hypothetical protein
MKKNSTNFYKERILFLINFEPDKSLQEQTGPGILTPNTIPSNVNRDTSNEYPNYCKYPNKAVSPGIKIKGASGKDALIPNYCYYKSPIKNSEKGGITGIFIPKNAEIKFFKEGDILKTLKDISIKYKENERELGINLRTILPIDGVFKFYDDDGEEYIARIYQPETNGDWVFKGYFKSDGITEYIPPKWEDPRTPYMRFIDEWGTLISFSTFVVSAILTPFTGGGSMALWLEFAIEMGVGTAIAIRDYQKGDNIGAAFSLMQGMLPLLKNSKILTGISKSELKELEEEIVRAGINGNSSQNELISFYDNLATTKPHLQKTLTKIFDQDPYTKLKLSKNLGEALGKQVTDNIMNEMKIMFKENPNMFKDLKFRERLWFRELSLNGIFILLELVAQIVLGRVLNDEEKAKLYQIFTNIPDSHKKDFYLSFISNMENLDTILESEETEKFLFKGKVSTEGIVEYQEYLKSMEKLK